MTPEVRALVDTSGGEVAHASLADLVLDQARWAGQLFLRHGRESALAIADAVGEAAGANAQRHAEWAVEEAGFGVVADKAEKNRMTGKPLVDHYRGEDFVGLRIDAERKVVRFPRPAGVVFALSPSTNPVATINFKVVLAMLTRNAIVISPHPAVRECSVDAARTLAAAAEAAGAPAGAVQVVEQPGVRLVEAFMRSPKTGLILATGGSGMVRAAYSSSTPAIGVGPGNAPAYVDESADLAQAAARIVASKAYDNSVLCTSESVVVTLESVGDRLLGELRRAGAHVCDDDETGRLRAYLFGPGGFNVEAIGRDAAWIARQCSFNVPAATKVLVAKISQAGPEEPLSGEKLCPVLSFLEAPSRRRAYAAARAILRHSGAGHSAAFHGSDESAALEYAQAVEVYRVVVNAPCSQGAAGFQTNLAPSFTVGTGFFGRSTVCENITPHHLLHWTSIAHNSDPAEAFGDYSGLDLTLQGPLPEAPADGVPGSAERYSQATGTAPAADPAEAAQETVTRFGKGLVAAHQVSALPEGAVVETGPGTIVTPLAEDEIRRLGIQVRRRRE